MMRVDPNGPCANPPLARILVVDDEAEMREVLADHLHTTFAVTTTQDGNAALAAIGSDVPDLVLLDLMMPGLNGLEVLRRIRRGAPSVAVVMLTGLGDEALTRAMLRMGAFDYVAKPFDWDRVEQVVLAALGRPARAGG